MRHDNVLFEFLSAGHKPEDSRGSVVIDRDRMVLEVECEGDRPYLIEGTRRDGFHAGRHAGPPGDSSTEARWASVGDLFVGQWIEDGDEWLFKFVLPGG
jgi:hypothetical protein